MFNTSTVFLLCILPIVYACSVLVQPGIHVNYYSCSNDPYKYIFSLGEWNYLGPVGETAHATFDTRDGAVEKYPTTDAVILCDELIDPTTHDYSISANCTPDGLMWIVNQNGTKIGQFKFEFLHEDNFFYEALLFFYDPDTDNFVIQFGSSHMDAINVLVSRDTFEIVSRVTADKMPSTTWCRSYTVKDGACFAQNDCEQFTNLTTVEYYSDAKILNLVDSFAYQCSVPYLSYVYNPSTGLTRPIESTFTHTSYKKIGNMHQAIRKLDENTVEVYTWPPFTVHTYTISDQQTRKVLGLDNNNSNHKTSNTGAIIGLVFFFLIVFISVALLAYHFKYKKGRGNQKKALESTSADYDIDLDYD